MFEFKICDMCGEKYIPKAGSIYKINFASKRYNFCCYTCYIKAVRCKEMIKENRSESFYKKLRQELQANK
jgi:hypothetical protein